MHARLLQTQNSGNQMNAAMFGILGTVAMLFMLVPVRLGAQEADGDFEGEKTWTDKAGNSHDIKPDLKALTKDSKLRTALNKILTDGKVAGDADDEVFESYAQCLVRPLTWKSNISNLPTQRKEVKRNLIRAGKAASAELHTRLNNLTLQVCTDVAKDARYPRAVRINCTLMLAELDEREAAPGGAPAVPLPAATSALVDFMADDKQPLFIRLEATNALMRHIHPGMAPAVQTRAADSVLTILKAPMPEGKKLDGHIWLRHRGSELLLAMIENKLPVDQAALTSSLAMLIAEETLPEWARALYAGDLGKLEGKSLPPAESGPAIRALAGLTLAILQASPFLTYEEPEAETGQPAGNRPEEKKDTKKEDKDNKKDDKDKEADKKPAAAAEPLSPAAQKLLSDEMMWQLAYIRRALYGKDEPRGKDNGPDARFGLHSAANEEDKQVAAKIVSDIDKSVKALTEVPEKLDKLADTLQTANENLEDILSVSSDETTETAAGDAAEPGQAAEKVVADRR